MFRMIVSMAKTYLVVKAIDVVREAFANRGANDKNTKRPARAKSRKAPA